MPLEEKVKVRNLGGGKLMNPSNDPNNSHLHSMFTFTILFHSSKTLPFSLFVGRSQIQQRSLKSKWD